MICLSGRRVSSLLCGWVTNPAHPPPFALFSSLWFRGRHGAVLVQVSTWLLPPQLALIAWCDNGSGLARGTEMIGWIILYLNFIRRRSRWGTDAQLQEETADFSHRIIHQKYYAQDVRNETWWGVYYVRN